MLQSIRNHSQGWLTSTIIVIIVIFFVIWGVRSYFENEGEGSEYSVAKINGETITGNEITSAYNRLRQQEQMELGADFSTNAQSTIDLKNIALNQRIVLLLWSLEAKKQGFRITQEEVDQALLKIPAFQIERRFSDKRFYEILRNTYYTEQDFLEDLRKSMLHDQLRLGILTSAFTLPYEQANSLKLINQRRNISYLIIPTAGFNNKKITIGIGEARNYYDSHIFLFKLPEKVQINYLLLSLPDIAKKLTFTNNSLLASYQQNLKNYTRPKYWAVQKISLSFSSNATTEQIAEAKQRIDGIANQLAAGIPLNKIIKFPVTLESTKIIANGQYPQLESELNKLDHIGNITPSIQVGKNFLIMRLVKAFPEKIRPFEEVRMQVKKDLGTQTAQQIFRNKVEQLNTLIENNPTTLKIAANQLGLPLLTSEFFARNGAPQGFLSAPKVLATAFSENVLDGNNSNPIDINDESVLVLRIHQHIPESSAPFESVYEKIQKILRTQKANEAARLAGEAVVKKLTIDSHLLTEPTKNSGVNWKTFNQIQRYGNQIPSAILKAAFDIPAPEKSHYSVKGFSLPSGDYVIVKITKPGSKNTNKIPMTQQNIYRQELEKSNGQLDYALYTQALIQQSRIIVYHKPSNNFAQGSS